MLNKNIDGIRKLPIKPRDKKIILNKRQTVRVDSITKRQALPKAKAKKVVQKLHYNTAFKPAVKKYPRYNFPRQFFSKISRQQRVSVLAAVLALFLAFGGGVWFTLNTSKSQADVQGEVLGDQTTVPSGQVVLPDTGSISQNDSNVNNNILFNTPIQYLQNYFESVAEPDIINQRKNQLEAFLTSMHSPLASAAETIAQQPHWQLILAISFAESSLGKNCNDNNCSNIGVAPGSPFWRKYASYQDWVVDFNRLLDKKYNNWTLEQMCGVYVKPCNPNWLLATQEILDQLKQNNIN